MTIIVSHFRRSFVPLAIALGVMIGMAQDAPAQTGGVPQPECIVLRSPADGNTTGTSWPGGIVPYSFNANVSAFNQMAMRNAMDEIQCKANINFIPRTTQPNYLFIQSSSGNNSYVGMIGGGQTVNIFNFDVKFIMVHELLHALGFEHEHQRYDQTSHVQIVYGNICQTCCGGSCNYNFDTVPQSHAVGSYDFDSVMHYKKTAFSINGQNTIVVLPPNQGWQDLIGQRTHLSTGDRSALQFRYGVGMCDPLFGFGTSIFGEHEGDRLGTSVAVLSDFNNDTIPDILVGAPFNGEAGLKAGKVYVLSGVDGQELWSKLGEAAGDRFGTAVAALDDLAVIAAPYNDEKGPDAGKVYVFDSAGTLVTAKKGKRAGDRFGASLAGSGDADNDGVNDLLIGAPYFDTSKSNAGAAYLYQGGTYQQLKKFSGQGAGDLFGSAVSFAPKSAAADYVLIGAPNHDAAASNAGRVYVYTGGTFGLLLTRDGAKAGDAFGAAITGYSISNGFSPCFAVGSPKYDAGSKTDAGRVAAYLINNGLVLWTKNGAAAGDNFGSSLACAGSPNADAHEDVIAGAWGSDVNGSNSGRAYVCAGLNGDTLFRFDGQTGGDKSGAAVAGRGAVDPDGRCRFLIGMPNADGLGDKMGRASLYLTPEPFNAGLEASATSLTTCPGDLAGGDNVVDALDLVAVMNEWVRCSNGCLACPTPTSGECTVGIEDVMRILSVWGPCH